MDSDDFIADTVLEDFYKVAEEFNADVVHAQMSLAYNKIEGKFEPKPTKFEKSTVNLKPTLETFDIAKRVDDFLGGKYNSRIWNKILRREFLIENQICFPEISVSEDYPFSVMLISCAKNYVRVPFIAYFYRKHSDSVTHNKFTSLEEGILDLNEGVYFLDNFLKSHEFFIENPTYRYLLVDDFCQLFMRLSSKGILLNPNFDLGKIYEVCCRRIFTADPQKNIPLTSYLFATTNVYKLLVKQQAAEITRLKNLLQDK